MWKLALAWVTKPELRFAAKIGGLVWGLAQNVMNGKDEEKELRKVIAATYPLLPEHAKETATEKEIIDAVVAGKDFFLAVAALFQK